MLSLFAHLNPARLPTLAATAGGKAGLRAEADHCPPERVNVGSGARRAVHDPAKPGSVAHFSIRSLFSFRRPQPADELAGDYPPSDCWPADLSAYRVPVSGDHEAAARLLNRGGMAIGAQGVAEVEAMLAALRDRGAIHGPAYVAKPTHLSPGKFSDNTGGRS